MNAQPHAIALGTAHAIALASFTRSVSAKRREGKGRHRTAPQGNHSFGHLPSMRHLVKGAIATNGWSK